MSVYVPSTPFRLQPRPGKLHADMNLEELKPYMCEASEGNFLECADCQNKCGAGKRISKIIDNETKPSKTAMTQKERSCMTKKMEAMQNYLNTMRAPDPVAYVTEHFGAKTNRMAKQRIYNWRSNYGSNLNMIEGKIALIAAELESAEKKAEEIKEEKKEEIKEEKKEEIKEEKTEKNTAEEKEEKKAEPVKPAVVDRETPLPRSPAAYLERKRREETVNDAIAGKREELELLICECDQEIERSKKAIEDAERRIVEYTEQIQALRRVQDIFKPKK